MYKKIGLLLAPLVLGAFSANASMTEEFHPELVPTIEQGQQIILGAKQDNPYSLSDINTEATHFYIKFMPENKDQQELLSAQNDLEIFTYPMDREILQGGEYYTDESLQAGVLPYQYAVAPVEHLLPSVPYEILDRLRLPGAAKSTPSATKSKAQGDIQSRWSWLPATRHGGNIALWDDYTQSYKPVVGLKIRATSWFRTTYVTTDKKGNFSVPYSYWPVGYRYEWNDSKFDIQKVKHLFRTQNPILEVDVYSSTPLAYHSPSMRSAWNVRIGGHHKINAQVLAANAWLAAKHYFYGNILGTTRPTELPVKPIFANKKITIGIDPLEGSTDAKYGSTSYTHYKDVQPRVFLYLRDFINTEKSSTWMYYVTLHELTHVVHFDNLIKLYDWGFGVGCRMKHCLNGKVREGWAVGLANELTKLNYPNFISSDENPFQGGSAYTGIIIDMIDPAVEGTYDRVSGYTPKQIEAAIREAGIGDSVDLYDLIKILKKLYDNPTENQLDALVEKWGN